MGRRKQVYILGEDKESSNKQFGKLLNNFDITQLVVKTEYARDMTTCLGELEALIVKQGCITCGDIRTNILDDFNHKSTIYKTELFTIGRVVWLKLQRLDNDMSACTNLKGIILDVNL